MSTSLENDEEKKEWVKSRDPPEEFEKEKGI
jgi:hypothetical protein